MSSVCQVYLLLHILLSQEKPQSSWQGCLLLRKVWQEGPYQRAEGKKELSWRWARRREVDQHVVSGSVFSSKAILLCWLIISSSVEQGRIDYYHKPVQESEGKQLIIIRTICNLKVGFIASKQNNLLWSGKLLSLDSSVFIIWNVLSLPCKEMLSQWYLRSGYTDLI